MKSSPRGPDSVSPKRAKERRSLSSILPRISQNRSTWDTAGNSGSQASVTIIRGLSLNEIEFSDILSIIWKEARVAVLCGLSLAVACFGKILLVDYLILGSFAEVTVASPFVIMGVICVTLAITVLFAKIVGCSLPLFAKKLGFDPAVMASPFITTIVDALSLLVYFGVANIFLPL